jgi:hypothetical protein
MGSNFLPWCTIIILACACPFRTKTPTPFHCNIHEHRTNHKTCLSLCFRGLYLMCNFGFRNSALYMKIVSRDSSIGIVTGHVLDGPDSIPGSAKFFLSPQSPVRHWSPPSLIYNGYRGSLLGMKCPVCEAHHSPPSSPEVKNDGVVPLLSRCLHGSV